LQAFYGIVGKFSGSAGVPYHKELVIMTRHNLVADEQLGLITRRQWELNRRVLEGSLDPDTVAKALQIVLEGHFPTGRSPHLSDLYVSAEQQIENMRRWNTERDWRLTDKDFAKVGTPPIWPSHWLSVLVLVPQLGSFHYTFTELWKLLGLRTGIKKSGRVKLTRNSLRPTETTQEWLDKSPPALKWMIIDLEGPTKSWRHDYWRTGPGVSYELLAAFCHMPQLGEAMDGANIPYGFNLQGCTVIDDDGNAVVPILQNINWHEKPRKFELVLPKQAHSPIDTSDPAEYHFYRAQRGY
jgi:hypothetical protein